MGYYPEDADGYARQFIFEDSVDAAVRALGIDDDDQDDDQDDDELEIEEDIEDDDYLDIDEDPEEYVPTEEDMAFCSVLSMIIETRRDLQSAARREFIEAMEWCDMIEAIEDGYRSERDIVVN